MNKWLLGALFFTINFLIILLPRLMTGAISNESVIFWAIWINSLFFLFLILPYKASYFFEENKSIFGLSIDKIISSTNSTNTNGSEKRMVDTILNTNSTNTNGSEKRMVDTILNTTSTTTNGTQTSIVDTIIDVVTPGKINSRSVSLKKNSSGNIVTNTVDIVKNLFK